MHTHVHTHIHASLETTPGTALCSSLPPGLCREPQTSEWVIKGEIDVKLEGAQLGVPWAPYECLTRATFQASALNTIRLFPWGTGISNDTKALNKRLLNEWGRESGKKEKKVGEQVEKFWHSLFWSLRRVAMLNFLKKRLTFHGFACNGHSTQTCQMNTWWWDKWKCNLLST